MSELDPLSALRDAIAERLAAAALFTGPPAVAVITEEAGDIASLVEQGLGRLGLCVTVMMLSLEPGAAEYESVVRPVVVVEENVLINRSSGGSQVTNWAAAWEVLNQLVGWAPGDGWRAFGRPKIQLSSTSPTVVRQVTVETSGVFSVESG